MRGDVVDALKKCAEALQHGNPRLANAEMGRVLFLAEKETKPTTRRLIGYFAQALACRAYGLHPKYFSFPSPDWKFWMCNWCDLFGTVGRCISHVVKGKCKVHVIELVKHMDGYEQWASMLFEVDTWGDWGDLTHLRLSFLVQEKFEFSKESEERLIGFANNCDIELEYKIIAVNSFADIDVSLLEMRDGEFVVVNCMFVFSKMLSEALALEKLLQRVRDVMTVDVMIVVEHDANHNLSDFLLRFDESLRYYSSLFEEAYLLREGEPYFRYEICNIVACEGSNRVERHQTWAQWKSLLIHHGFSIFKSFIKSEDKEYEELRENGILLISGTDTKERPGFFVSAWKILTSPSKSSGSNEG
ncbi:hypothetical protein SLEP1_g47016 [Rubroshorea leprosula]|uniref:GRAS family transcription factor n=1 Tax=Rubroshorea leprosula TaxID=152421 RepID=A0AAV5LPZ2_9ROSI|nr:hypothetical protein SLEP1_g47016 [Rubroshorea leprosula]